MKLFDTEGEGILQTTDRLYVDGTFSITPAPFKQLFTVGYVISGRMFPAIYALMPNKDTESYRLLFEYLFRMITAEETRRPKLVAIMSDFELAIRNAVSDACAGNKILRDNPIRMEGCLFHFAQALKHNAAEKGLYLNAASNIHSHKYSNLRRMLTNLAFLLPDDVSPTLDKILVRYADAINANVNLQEYMEYFRKQWMSDIEKWNLFYAGEHKSNNHMEGWHRGLNDLLQNRTRNMWHFLQTLQEDCASKNKDYMVFLYHGKVNWRGPTKAEVSKKARRELLIKHYKNGDLNPFGLVEALAGVE